MLACAVLIAPTAVYGNNSDSHSLGAGAISKAQPKIAQQPQANEQPVELFEADFKELDSQFEVWLSGLLDPSLYPGRCERLEPIRKRAKALKSRLQALQSPTSGLNQADRKKLERDLESLSEQNFCYYFLFMDHNYEEDLPDTLAREKRALDRFLHGDERGK